LIKAKESLTNPSDTNRIKRRTNKQLQLMIKGLLSWPLLTIIWEYNFSTLKDSNKLLKSTKKHLASHKRIYLKTSLSFKTLPKLCIPPLSKYKTKKEAIINLKNK